MILRSTRSLDRKSNRRYAKSLVEASENIPSLSGVENIKKSVIDFLYEKRILRWGSTGKLSRRSEENISPKRSDYYYDE